MEKSTIVAGLIGLIIGVVFSWMVFQPQTQTKVAGISATNEVSIKSLDFRMDMRKLWEDHITWTRMYIVSAANNNPDTKNIATRLLKNQEDLGNAITPYYGIDAGNKLTDLLKEHINGAVALVDAAKSKDQNALKTANDRWYKNANDISDFLSQANPNIPNDKIRAEMKEHLDLTKQEAVDILNKDYDASVVGYDKIHDQILRMSDTLSTAIEKQFPDKF